MFTINENYLKLPGSYLFSDIAKKIAAYQKENPEKEIIRLGIGDVTQPWRRRSLRLFTELWKRWLMQRPSTDMRRIRATLS